MIGVIETSEAFRMAREAGLDLVEISPDTRPPVCRICEIGKYKYDLSKKEKATRARSRGQEMKEVRLGRSLKIDPHDLGIRLDQARRFLLAGHKVQIVQNFRGREMMHRQRGVERLNSLAEELEDVAKVEVPPRLAGRRVTMIFAPDRNKISVIRQREAQRAKTEAEAARAPEAPVDDTPPTGDVEPTND